MASSACALEITLDGANEGRVFEGVGAVSAGASSRLLIDYPEPQRSQILDYLFKPGFGAALQHLKVEVGGEINSTDGTEPTHMRTRHDLNFTRGYEWWLMKEAKKRNPSILLDCLAWGAPGWIGDGNYWSQDMADYVVQFIKGAKSVHGLDMNYTGIRNETGNNTNWIITLRNTLDANGLASVKVVAGDEWGGSWAIVGDLLANPAVFNAVHAVGAHYPNTQSPENAKTLGKPIWSSEDGIGGSTWYRAGYLAKLFNRNYVNGKMTKTEIWSPVTAYYDNLVAADSGFMRANTPWSGSYFVAPAVWAAAHTTQFAWPGWKYLEGGACGLLPGGGSLVTLKSTNNLDYSIIVETIDATASQLVTFRLTNGLSRAPVRVWQTLSGNYFAQIATIQPAGGAFSHTVAPGAIYSFTTTFGQGKGTAEPPAEVPFTLPFVESFEDYALNATPRYLSDQAGTFEVIDRADGQGKCLRQVLPQIGIRWMGEYYPYTLLGEMNWRDYEVSADVLIETNGFAFVMGRIGTIPSFSDVAPQAYWLKIQTSPGLWELYAATNLLASGQIAVAANAWYKLRLAMMGGTLQAYVNGVRVSQVSDSRYAAGLAAIGCGWHQGQFDNFAVRKLHKGAGNLALSATARASSTWSAEYAADKANDGDAVTRWNSAWPTAAQEWLELDFAGPTKFGQVNFTQLDDRITGYKIQGWNGSGWNDLVVAGRMGTIASHSFPTTTNSKVRLLVTNMTSTPSIFEFSVFEDTPATNLARSATASASSVWDSSGNYAAGKSNDGDSGTRWNAAPGRIAGEWVQLDWSASVSFNRTYLSQFGDRITDYKIQRWTGSAWVDVVSAGPLGSARTDTFATVTASRIRMLVVNASNIPSISEFQVFNDPVPLGSSSVCINEWLPVNTRTLADPADGRFDPWFELYNRGSNSVSLGGYYLSGVSTNRFQFQIPNGVSLAPGGFLLAWADREPAQYQPGGDLHVSFSLVPGQVLTLTAPDGRLADAIELEPLQPDQAQGSRTDGDLAILPMVTPTPRASNNQIHATSMSLDRASQEVVMDFLGFPFAQHQIQWSGLLDNPCWSNALTIDANALGAFGFRATSTTNISSRFFRAVAP